ncbi:hypothetical protein Bbelb_098420 [Branchiostoma belcheri]|nr:hypothetical protein Bbelb_098420 [Branchiostoma belcheri]
MGCAVDSDVVCSCGGVGRVFMACYRGKFTNSYGGVGQNCGSFQRRCFWKINVPGSRRSSPGNPTPRGNTWEDGDKEMCQGKLNAPIGNLRLVSGFCWQESPERQDVSGGTLTFIHVRQLDSSRKKNGQNYAEFGPFQTTLYRSVHNVAINSPSLPLGRYIDSTCGFTPTIIQGSTPLWVTEVGKGKVEGARPRGRPRRSWITDLKEWTGLTANQMARLAEDRQQWKNLANHHAAPTAD